MPEALTRRGLLLGLAAPAVASCTIGPHKKVVSVTDHGAVGDGQSDDTAAFLSAIKEVQGAGGGTVEVPGVARSFRVSLVSCPSGVVLRGKGTEMPRLLGSVEIAASADDAAIENLEVRMTRGTGIRIREGAIRSSLRGVVVSGSSAVPATTTTGILVSRGTRDTVIDRCRIDSCQEGIRASGGFHGLTVSRSNFSAWLDRAIYLVAYAGAVTKVRIEANTVGPPLSRGRVRQPIAFAGFAGNRFADVEIRKNSVKGSGRSYTAQEEPGAADLISLHACDRFQIDANTCSQGGDMGITVSQGCRSGTVTANICTENDAAGIIIGTGPLTEDVVVERNRCVNNGRNRSGDRNARNRAGIIVRQSKRIRVASNEIGDTNRHLTQSTGILVDRSVQVGVEFNKVVGSQPRMVVR